MATILLKNLQRLNTQDLCMAMQECAEADCENKVSSAFSCSVCDEFKCIDCMTESSMSICLMCDAQEVEYALPSFGEWDGGSIRSWFYAGFISTFLERCREGKSFTIYMPFADTETGFRLTLPTVPWSELDDHIQEARELLANSSLIGSCSLNSQRHQRCLRLCDRAFLPTTLGGRA